ncbi:RNA polymerase II elongation factor ELL2-like [Crocuta crocuta]
MDRYDYMAAYGGRALGTVVHQEGDVDVGKANGLEPRQDHVTGLPVQLTRPDTQALNYYQNYENTVPQASFQFDELEELIKTPPDDSPTEKYNFNFLLSDMGNDDYQDHTQALDYYQNYENTVSPQASFQFEGLEELIKPPPNNSPSGKYNLNVLLSDVGNNDYQDQTQQTSSIYTSSPLSCLSLMEDKGMACETTYSYQMTQVRKPQTEKESLNKWERFRKLRVQKRAPIRKAPQTVPDPVPERKRTTPINPAYTIRKSRVANSIHMRPYRDRVIHLLALKDYKKPELLLRLQKDGIPRDEKNSLGEILFQVANLNTQNFSYTLKDHIYKELQKDWPGYNELDRQSLELVLSRKADTFQNASGTKHTESSRGSGVDKTWEDQFYNLSHINLSRKKVRISHLTTATQSMSNSHSSNTSTNSTVGLSQPSGAAANSLPPPLPPAHHPLPNPPQPKCSNSKSCSFARGPGAQDPGVNSSIQNRKIFGGEQRKHTSLETLTPISVRRKYLKLKKKKQSKSHKKSKSKCREHKAKKQECNIEVMETETQKPEPERQGESAQPNPNEVAEEVSTASDKTCSASDIPDYLANYVTISSSEQRRHYEQEFRAEYDEYYALYTKMVSLSQEFIHLDSKRKHLSPDSRKYQKINKKISLKYEKMKRIHPNYYEEKDRCQYLYNKLAHIKRLIKDYDRQQVQALH